MNFWKKLAIDLLFCALFYVLYKLLGFELAVIIGLAQIVSHLVQKEYKKKPASVHTIYSPTQKNKFKF